TKFAGETEKEETTERLEQMVSAQQPEQTTTVQQPQHTETAEHPQAPARTTYNSFYNEYLLQFCGYTCKAANYYEDVYPFENDKTGARWKRIQNVASLPLVSPGAHFFA